MGKNNETSSANVSAQGKNMAVISLLLGIAAVIFLFIGTNVYISIGLGLIGLLFSYLAKNHEYTGGYRTAGIIFSGIGLLIGLVGWVSFSFFVTMF